MQQHCPDDPVRTVIVTVGVPVEFLVGVGNVALPDAFGMHLNRAKAISIRTQILIRVTQAELSRQRRHRAPVLRIIGPEAVDHHVGLFDPSDKRRALDS